LGTWPAGGEPDVGLHNQVVTFGYILGRAANERSRLSVLDWGGGLGHYYVYARELYPQLTFEYVIKDLAVFCDAGRVLLPSIHFTADDDAALARRYDLVFASNSVQYSCRLYDTIGRLAQSARKWLVITRLPCLFVSDDFVVVQRPRSHGYLTEYPCWFVNREKVLHFIEACGFVLRREFLQTQLPVVLRAPEQCRYTGFLFERSTNDLVRNVPRADSALDEAASRLECSRQSTG
jgi:putative methyltransferase (TIGR04325 family)